MWNKAGLFTGKEDVHLTAEGFKMSEAVGALIRDIHISKVFTSAQVRSMETEICMMNGSGQYCAGTMHASALNERDYGIYTGLNKFEKERELGEEEYNELRRGWDYPIPGGETLKQVYERVLPFFQQEILPLLNKGMNVLVVSHGNTLRALIKYLENISDEEIVNVEMPFHEVYIYELDAEGHKINKEIRKIEHLIKDKEGHLTRSKVKIVATIGPSSEKIEILDEMLKAGMDMARLNFAWGELAEKARQINNIRKASEENGIPVMIIGDLPGPRIQDTDGHTYDIEKQKALTTKDCELVEFSVKNNLEYLAMSFVGNKDDVLDCKNEIKKHNGTQKVIAKIERAVALDNLDEIIENSDAIMIARGDLGNEIPLERIPFIQAEIIQKCKVAGKPVITATQMLYSMKDNPSPTRAEVTDVINAVLEGTDATMLSEETTSGKYPIQAVYTMEHVALEAEKHLQNPKFNPF